MKWTKREENIDAKQKEMTTLFYIVSYDDLRIHMHKQTRTRWLIQIKDDDPEIEKEME